MDIGARKGCQNFPFSERGLIWKESNFKTLDIQFSLNVNLLYNLNYIYTYVETDTEYFKLLAF